MSITSALNRWNSLYEEITKDKQYSNGAVFGLKPLLMDANNRIYIAENIDKEMSIYIEFESDTVLKTYTAPVLQGVSITSKRDIVQKGYFYFKISREKECPDEIFISLSISLADGIEESPNDVKTLVIINDVLKRYSHLFTKKNKSLSREEEQGLYCELLYLETLIDREGESAIRYWTGPQKNKHDFILSEKEAVEIKSTNNEEQLIIHISNENQLDNSGLDELLLVAYVIEVSNTGENLNGVIDRILTKINDADIYLLFLTDLALVEIDPFVFKSNYRFAIVKRLTFLVDDVFPKISKSSISTKAFDVKYRLNLSDEYPLEED